jgi:hypothetical protein
VSLPHAQTGRPDGTSRTLSTHRSFLVRLYSESDPQAPRLAGRVEHVVSGECREFDSITELLDFISGVLHGCAPQHAQEKR